MTNLEQARKDRDNMEFLIFNLIKDFAKKYPDLKIDDVWIRPEYHEGDGKRKLVSVEVNVNVLV